MNKNNGGPAFPKQPHRLTNGMLEGNNEGMSLRDWFAAKAMQGMLQRTDEYAELIARASYRMADAMLKAREE